MQNEYANSTAFDFSNYDSSSEDEAAKLPKTTRKRSRRDFEPTSSASLAAPTFHELHTVETSSTSTNLDFIIYGHPCMLHEDRNGLAKELEDEKNLIDVLDTDSGFDHEITYAVSTTPFEKNNQKNINDGDSMHLYVDKYDVRTLMTREDLFLLNEDTYRENEEWDDDLTLEERKELEELRFGDMYISSSSIRCQEHTDPKEYAVEREPKKAHLSDGNIEIAKAQTENELSTAAAIDKKDDENNSSMVFELEESIRSIIPANTTIPSTKRQFDIIQMTAKKSCDQPQFELFLKVKEETNPDFQFLSEENELYPFYLALKKSLETKTDKRSESRKKAIGLLDMYSSSSSDEENEQKSHIGAASIEEKVIKEEVSANGQNNTENSNELSKEEKRAMRLKKAKLLRHRFQQS